MMNRRDLFRRVVGALLGTAAAPVLANALPVASRHDWYGCDWAEGDDWTVTIYTGKAQ